MAANAFPGTPIAPMYPEGMKGAPTKQINGFLRKQP